MPSPKVSIKQMQIGCRHWANMSVTRQGPCVAPTRDQKAAVTVAPQTQNSAAQKALA